MIKKPKSQRERLQKSIEKKIKEKKERKRKYECLLGARMMLKLIHCMKFSLNLQIPAVPYSAWHAADAGWV